MDDHANPYWEICRGKWGFVSPVLPQLVGNYNFRNANPDLPQRQPVPVVVGHYIDRCITIQWGGTP